ncbi:Putative polysaccharide export protein wza [Halomicronema hongdechloris C2206]|uniref:Polysaccharide export protein wza n=1 Tax=Halomicronema hongdechloris C2206 TaxID=1641165 RepID=A0A1Z3HMR8_9CYAN|nr:polysaccharide biosynthesis/export family protein [Halomicronema hongdechloris]ASC71556.1 Putative polysaccharide export protein wza [Halomicronema hongdechloris C2206]
MITRWIPLMAASVGLWLTFPMAPTRAVTEAVGALPATARADYVLGPGDQVAISIIGYEEFTGSRVILPDGTISMPLIGSVAAAGRTTEALAAELTARLGVYLVNPVVDVSLTVLRPVVVTVAGEVYRPGPVQLSSLTQADTRLDTNSRITSSTNTPTLASALTAAGGVQRTADVRQVRVQRTLPTGQVTSYTVNLWEAIVSGTQADNLVLRDGDAVYVPAAEPGDVDPRLVASSSVAPSTVRVRVIGEVNRPGQVEVPPNSSVSGAVAVAGGPTDDARLKEVVLVRLNDQGQVEETVLDLRNMVDAEQVQDGDVVLVAKHGYLNVLDGIGRVIQGVFPPLRLLDVLGTFD